MCSEETSPRFNRDNDLTSVNRIESNHQVSIHLKKSVFVCLFCNSIIIRQRRRCQAEHSESSVSEQPTRSSMSYGSLPDQFDQTSGPSPTATHLPRYTRVDHKTVWFVISFF